MDIFKRFMSGDKNTRSLQLSGMIRFMCVFLQGVVLVKIGVSHEIIGLIELLFFLSEFSRYFILNGTKTASFAWSGEVDDTRRSRFLTIHFYAIISVIIVCVSFYFSSYYDDNLLRLALLVAFTFFTIMAEQYDWIFLEKKMGSHLIPYALVVYSLQAVVVILSIFYFSINIMLLGVTVILFLRLVHCHWLLRSGSFVRKSMISFATVVTPLVAQAVVSGLMPFIDLWIVQSYYDETTFLYFKYGARQFPLFLILLAGLRQGLLSKLRFSDLKIKAMEVKDEIGTHAHIIFIPAILLMLLSPLLYTLVYDDGFILSALIFNTYLLILVVDVIIVQVFFYLQGDEWMLFKYSTAEVLLNLILSLTLVQFYGLNGIVWATVIANLFMKSLQLYWINHKYGLSLNRVVPVRLCSGYVLILIVSYVASILLY